MTLLHSTRDKDKKQITYTDALLTGLAPDGGLYVPSEYPQLTDSNLSILRCHSEIFSNIAVRVKARFAGDSISRDQLEVLAMHAYDPVKFPESPHKIVPIRQIDDGLFIQNLSLGPTAAFKDIPLQMVAQEMNYELERRNQTLTLLGATSGDTGSAAEAAVQGLERIKIFMLSPQVGMSDFQRAQMGSLTGDNVFNISIDGRFDPCQDLVKLCNMDAEFKSKYNLGAVNSINWGRISSQVAYVISGYVQATKRNTEVDFVVPTGNFGNVLSVYIAKQMGVPIRRIIIATNENNIIDRMMKTGTYDVRPAQITSSPSMDISKASNFERLFYDMVEGDSSQVRQFVEKLNKDGKVDMTHYGITPQKFQDLGFFSGTSTHQDRINTINQVYATSRSIIDPHTADAVTVGMRLFDNRDVPMICFETALPVKFEQTINEALGFVPPRVPRFRDLESSIGRHGFHNMSVDANALKQYIRERA